MRKSILLLVCLLLMLSLCACSGWGTTNGRDLVNMETSHGDGYAAIVWEDRVYVPYCAISNSARGDQIGIADRDEDHRVYAYKGYPEEEWIIDMYVSGLMDGAMLMREMHVTEIPEGLESEYEWNK